MMGDWLSPLTVEEIKAICLTLNITLSNAVCKSRLKLVEFLENVDSDKRAELEGLRDQKKLTKRGSSKRKRAEASTTGDTTKRAKPGTSDEQSPTFGTQELVKAVPKPRFMQLPSAKEIHDRCVEFLDALSPHAVAEVVCASCTRLHWQSESTIVSIDSIPHSNHLHPVWNPHPAHVLMDGMLLETKGIQCNNTKGASVHLCGECLHHLSSNKLPPFTLLNKMWIGPVPEVLSQLTMLEQLLLTPVYPQCFVYKLHPKSGSTGDPTREQSGLRGNVTSFLMNTDEVVEMLKGAKMPRPASILASVLAITYVGVGQLPINWLKLMFCVRHRAVLEALAWLIQNNKYFLGYVIDEEVVTSLPEDNVPVEIIASIRQETQMDILEKESDACVPGSLMTEVVVGKDKMGMGFNKVRMDWNTFNYATV
ncbi:uncharacterized protein EI90DRAFT_3022553 [Cantharellus anzutake]|uniref:uncharacterized protein n=1 Tax=Cantharellus anzutake TaxID=1750568 RepID=UPI0019033C61|nr:uncharacterized protein EI90DRAFT_3022553 [Cantharellus anzutake]KAF8313745.1 hypothetical protein EI90DRAFT_3022553 [Cantharellus anzutake]